MAKALTKRELFQWKDKVGRKIAERRLCNAGISLSMTAKLLAGTYPSHVGELHEKAIRTAMAEK